MSLFSSQFLSVLAYLAVFPLLVYSVGLAPGLYCGTVTCYDVLEISRDDFNKTDLPRIYRRLARQYHPDRVKLEKNREEAEEQFRLIATAYETLKDDETREYYDYYLDHPEERYYNYYQYYRLRTAPRVDVRIVIVVAILLVSTIQYLSAHQKYREALKYAKEQVKFRSMAVEIARERGVLDFDKLTGKVKKKQKNGDLVFSSIIEENINISGGYRPPSVYQTLAWQLIILPLTLLGQMRWGASWVFNFWICKRDYDDEAKLYLIRRNLKLSEEQFQSTDQKLIDEYLIKELWKKPVFDQWKLEKDLEEKEKLAKSGRYKQYQRFQRKQAGSTISFLDEM
ncbi:J domain-containing protein [Meloidogyne graminicola]|uniref:J domain-containing protein n=1 Tax=Meloidogyne graminicola TaxID=189291 RepID=A0A8S9ZQ45_9BILA|nr:J domain-containing protein [Meloidogyne graminicola]